jgi:hypothetical protein
VGVPDFLEESASGHRCHSPGVPRMNAETNGSLRC